MTNEWERLEYESGDSKAVAGLLLSKIEDENWRTVNLDPVVYERQRAAWIELKKQGYVKITTKINSNGVDKITITPQYKVGNPTYQHDAKQKTHQVEIIAEL